MPQIRTDQEWMTIFETQQQSGLTIAAFCNEQGLSARTFRRRKSRLNHSDANNHFVKVHTIEQGSTMTIEPASRALCTLQVGQITLSFPATVPTSWVAQLIREIHQ